VLVDKDKVDKAMVGVCLSEKKEDASVVGRDENCMKCLFITGFFFYTISLIYFFH
jgi:hypothetical protein